MILAVAKDFTPLWVIFSGGVPLIVYHLVFLAPRAKQGLSATEIDSVYYFGFLVTLGALGAGGYLASSGRFSENPTDILSHFGVGLIATGYAVIARLHLTSLAMKVDLDSVESLMDKQVESSQQILDNMMLVVADASRLALGMAEAREAIIKVAGDSMASVTASIAMEYRTQLSSILDDTRTLAERTATTVRALEDASASGLIQKVAALESQVVKVSSSLASFAEAAIDAAAASSSNTEESTRLVASTTALRESFEKAENIGTHMSTLSAQVATAVDSVGTLSSSIDNSASALVAAAAQVNEAPRAFRRLSAVSERAHSAMGEFAEILDKMATTTGAYNESADAVRRFSEAITSAGNRTESAVKAMTVLESGLSSVNAAAVGGAESLRELASIRADLSAAVSAVNAASKAWEAAPKLEATSRDLAILSARMTQMSEAMIKASEGIEVQISAVSQRLEMSTARSADQVVKLEERLVRLVDAIIVQTTRRQGVQA